ncbi:uncharacterized protein N7482_000919 [Penicillium canariense]|uniref:Uncharacterized protein n=1 Tax=Penicillium canariense TaxID=189055 RepID=A0A9W9IEP3_9EURO|nr:uncharacterized protein N7482_000919 [Penicillium canariense]KAJ5175042.1 hypothetical protein N7482_000919 [Penicillium canariense]
MSGLVFGRRRVYILSHLSALGPTICTAYSSASECLFAVPCEALPEISIPDIFFAHERVIWFCVIPLAVSTIIIFFGFEETLYFRTIVEGVYVDDNTSDDSNKETLLKEKIDETTPATKNYLTVQTSTQVIPSPLPSQSYLSKLKIFRSLQGRPSVKQMFFMMYRPLMIFFYFPSIDWAGFLYGIKLSWFTVLNGTMSAVLSATPY